MITMRDVAKAANVSQASVSFAFSRPEKLTSEVRDNILAVAKRLRYFGPHPAAKSLRSGKAGAIGFVVNDELAYALEDPAVTQILRGIGLVSDLASVALTILPCPVMPGRLRATSNDAPLIQRAHVDGFLFDSIPDHHPAVETALSRSVPVVIMGSPRLGNVLSVSIDERRAGRLAAEHIIGLGHRRIAILIDRVRSDGKRGPLTRTRRKGALNAVTALRLAGYEDAFSAVGLCFDAVPIFEAGGYLKLQADAAAAELLSRHSDVTAVIAISDVMAAAIMDQAAMRGLNVPGDLSVIGFDDVPIASERGLTTIKQPILEKGRIAAQMLMDAIAGRQVCSRMLEVTFVERTTTASL